MFLVDGPRDFGGNADLRESGRIATVYFAEIRAYLQEALIDGDPQLVATALGDVARAKGMASVARKAGLGRESLYKALAPDGNPQLSTVLSVLRALGLSLRVASNRA